MPDHTFPSDQQIITRCLAGDCESYALLVERYQEIISRQVRWYARSLNEIEEMTQEVFVQAYLSLATFGGKAPFAHWLKKIASRVGYAHLKELYRQRKNFPVDEFDSCTQQVEKLDAEEASRLLLPLLEQLAAEDRSVLVMTYIENLGTREIAEHMGWNRAMVKMRVYRAKKRIREITRRQFGPELYQNLLDCFA